MSKFYILRLLLLVDVTFSFVNLVDMLYNYATISFLIFVGDVAKCYIEIIYLCHVFWLFCRYYSNSSAQRSSKTFDLNTTIFVS